MKSHNVALSANGPRRIILPCLAVAFQEEFCYRCIDCNAIVGSVGQPNQCQKESEKYKMLNAMGGKGWDYEVGEQKT
jgi:hypothetical protein